MTVNTDIAALASQAWTLALWAARLALIALAIVNVASLYGLRVPLIPLVDATRLAHVAAAFWLSSKT
jgi:hypothetical protein